MLRYAVYPLLPSSLLSSMLVPSILVVAGRAEGGVSSRLSRNSPRLSALGMKLEGETAETRRRKLNNGSGMSKRDAATGYFERGSTVVIP